MKTDIRNRMDIEQLVRTFYSTAVPDAEIGHFFTRVVVVDWELHIPVMVDFWEQVLLGGTAYSGNPMDKHFTLNKKSAMESRHFARWIELWKNTVDLLFEGPVADEAKQRAVTIAGLMEHKICR